MNKKPIKVIWDVDSPEDLENLPNIVEIPLEIFDDESEDSVCDYLSDNYDFCVNSWSELPDKEDIAYICAKQIMNFKKRAKRVEKKWRREMVLAWIDESLYMDIDYEKSLYCYKHNINPETINVNDIFELTFNFL